MNPKIQWGKDGLVPCIIQDARDNAVLMLAYMNKASLAKTLKNGKVCFWSRSRKKLWLKGEESGHFQIVKKSYLDCDQDALLIQVKQIGEAACHTGRRSCFHQRLYANGKIKIEGKQIFNPKLVYQRR